MRAIIVDDEPLMIKKFMRLSQGIEGLDLIEEFEDGTSALEFVKDHVIDIAFLDVEMPVMDGITLAKRLKEIRKDILVVFITAYDEYIRESNLIGGDYYLVKPYTRDVLELMMDKIRLLANRQNKEIYIQTFGRFVVKKNGIPIRLTGKAKEILALIVTKCGKEISNEEIYSTIWEGRPYSNDNMAVYYNAIRRLRKSLKAAGVENLLISTARGQMVDPSVFDCDYYEWKNKNTDFRSYFEGEFLSEYSWGEHILTQILEEYGLLETKEEKK